MSTRSTGTRAVPPAARVFSSLQAADALLPGQTSALRKSGALFLALLVLGAVPLFWAANAAGLIGDLPAAVAKGSNSGPGGGHDDDDSGPGGGHDDDDDASAAATDDTSANGHSTRGTTNDNDTRTRLGTDDTSHNGNSTRGTTNDNDNDTNTNTRNSNTGTQTRTGGQTQTRTRTGS
jgi:hypothetical protein